MTDKPQLNPQVFAKRQSQGVPTLAAQTPNLRSTPSVTAFAADSVADTYRSFADDAGRLAQLADGQFKVSQQIFETAQSDVEEIQRIEAEAEYNKIILAGEKAVQETRLNSGLDTVVDDSISAYDKVQQQVMDGANLSAYQRAYLAPKLEQTRTSVSKSAYNFQRQARAQEARHTLKESVEAREFLANSHPDKLEELIAESNELIDSLGASLPQTERTALKESQRERLTISAAQGEIEKNPALALGKIKSGFYNDTLTLKQVKTLQSDAEIGIRKREAEAAKVVSAQRSRLDADLGVAISTGDIDKLPTQTQLDDLREKGAISDAQWESHSKARFNRLKSYRDDNESLILGNQIIENKLPVNPQNKDAVKAIDEAYNNMQPGIAALPPAERLVFVSDFIQTHRFVPSMLKGEMELAAGSGDQEQVLMAANLIDRVAKQSPYLVSQLISEKERQRIDMLNDRLNIGMEPKEAVLNVDQQLSIQNQASNEVIQSEISEINKTVDYREEVTDTFNSFFQWDVEEDGIANFDIDQAQMVYRIAFEDAYRITRDEEKSKKRAQEFVAGRFGRSSVNGDAQIMQFPPEHYYAIDGENNDWMREQMLDAARGDSGVMSNENFDDRVRLIPDAYLTPRTAKQGRPGYNLAVVGEDGVPRQINKPGELFYFDPTARRKEIVDDVKKRQQEISDLEELMGGRIE